MGRARGSGIWYSLVSCVWGGGRERCRGVGVAEARCWVLRDQAGFPGWCLGGGAALSVRAAGVLVCLPVFMGWVRAWGAGGGCGWGGGAAGCGSVCHRTVPVAGVGGCLLRGVRVGAGGGGAAVGAGRRCPFFENCTVDASIFVVKLVRAHGGCLGTRSR